MHARCRCTIVAYDGLQYGTRAARDFGDSLKGKSADFEGGESGGKKIKTPFGEVNGTKVKIKLSDGEVVDHYRRVPADMSYRDWKAVYIDKTKTFETWQAEFDARRKSDEQSPLRQRGRQVIDDLSAGRLPTAASGGKVGLAAGNVNLTVTQGTPPKLIGKLENVTPAAIQKTLEYYEAKIVNAPIENGIIITTTGEIYHCTGDLNTLPTIVELGEKLRGAYVTHNHPVGSVNEYSFSEDDRSLFNKFELNRLRGIDERFVYELNRNPDDLDSEDIIPEFLEGYSVHRLNIRTGVHKG